MGDRKVYENDFLETFEAPLPLLVDFLPDTVPSVHSLCVSPFVVYLDPILGFELAFVFLLSPGMPKSSDEALRGLSDCFELPFSLDEPKICSLRIDLMLFRNDGEVERLMGGVGG